MHDYDPNPPLTEPFGHMHHPITMATTTAPQEYPLLKESDIMEPSYEKRTIGSESLSSKCEDLLEMQEDNLPEDAADIARLLRDIRKEWIKCTHKVLGEFVKTLQCRECCIKPLSLNIILEYEQEYSPVFSMIVRSLKEVANDPEQVMEGIGPDDYIWDMLGELEAQWWHHHLAERHRASYFAQQNGVPQDHLPLTTPAVLWARQSFNFAPSPDVVKLKRDWLAKLKCLRYEPNLLTPPTGPPTIPAVSKRYRFEMKEGQLPVESYWDPEKQSYVVSLVHHSPELNDRSHPPNAPKALYPTTYPIVFSQEVLEPEIRSEPSGLNPSIANRQYNKDNSRSEGPSALRMNSTNAPASELWVASKAQSTTVNKRNATAAFQKAASGSLISNSQPPPRLVEIQPKRRGRPPTKQSMLLPGPPSQSTQVLTNQPFLELVGPNLQLPPALAEKERKRPGRPRKHFPGIPTQPNQVESTFVQTGRSTNYDALIDPRLIAISTGTRAILPSLPKAHVPVAPPKPQQFTVSDERAREAVAKPSSAPRLIVRLPIAPRKENPNNDPFCNEAPKLQIQIPKNGVDGQRKDKEVVTKQAATARPAINQASTSQSSTNQAGNNQAAFSQAGSNQAANQVTTHQARTNQARNNQSGTNQANNNRAASSQTGSNQAGNNQAASSQFGSNQATTSQSPTTQAGNNQAAFSQAGSNQAANQVTTNQAPTNPAGNNQSGTNQANNNRAASSQTGSNQAPTNQAGNNQAASSQFGSNQATTSQSPTTQAGNNQAAFSQAGSNQAANQVTTNQAPTNPAGNNQSGTNQAGNNQAASSQSGSNQATTNQAGNNQAASSQSGSNQAATNQASNNQSGTNQAGNNQAASSQSGSNQAATYQTATAQVGNSQAAPNQAATDQAAAKKVLKRQHTPTPDNSDLQDFTTYDDSTSQATTIDLQERRPEYISNQPRKPKRQRTINPNSNTAVAGVNFKSGSGSMVPQVEQQTEMTTPPVVRHPQINFPLPLARVDRVRLSVETSDSVAAQEIMSATSQETKRTRESSGFSTDDASDDVFEDYNEEEGLRSRGFRGKAPRRM